MGCGLTISWTSCGSAALLCATLGSAACSGSTGTGSPNDNAGNTSQGGSEDTAAGKGGGGNGGSGGPSGAGGAGGTGGSIDRAGAPQAGEAANAGSGGMAGVNECGPNVPCPNADDECADGACRTPPPKPATGCQYRYFSGHDYYFCDIKLDHAAAAAACGGAHMSLVHINDAAENDFINRLVATEACCSVSVMPAYHWAGLWIGASDATMHGQWRWDDDGTQFWEGLADGMAVGGAFASWDVDQPNNGNLGPDEYCVRTTGSLWNDTPCETDLFAEYPFDGIGYICES